MRYILAFLMILLGSTLLTACDQQNSKKQIQIILPAQNKSTSAIVDSFTQTLKETYHKPFGIKITDMQKAPNIENAIQKMRDDNIDIIVAIGDDAAKKTLAITPAQSVISLGSGLTDSDRQKLNPCNVAIVHGKSLSTSLIQFIHAVYPKVTNLTLIHSESNQVLPEVSETMLAAKQNGIKVNEISMNSLEKPALLAKKIPVNTQVVVILKDDLLMSGLSTLSKITTKRHIPLISSDPLSVNNGANFALGYSEKEMGVEGAKLAVSILHNKVACQLPVVEMNKLSVFINEKAAADIALDTGVIMDTAKKLNYLVVNQ